MPYFITPVDLLSVIIKLYPCDPLWEWEKPFYYSKYSLRNRSLDFPLLHSSFLPNSFFCRILILLSRWIKQEWHCLKKDHVFLNSFMSWNMTIKNPEEKVVFIDLIHILNNTKPSPQVQTKGDGFNKPSFLNNQKCDSSKKPFFSEYKSHV